MKRVSWLPTRRFCLTVGLVLIFSDVSGVQAQPAVDTYAAASLPADEDPRSSLLVPYGEEADLYYTTRQQVVVYPHPDSSRPYIRLRFREPVHVLNEERGWSQVETLGGARGYVPSGALSNVWIRISKSKKLVYVYRGTNLVKKIPADFGYNVFADKEQRGASNSPDHWRTPEGMFFVVSKNPRSKYYKALVLNYPNAEDATRGLRQGLISRNEHRAIVEAERRFAMPPMNTPLGGWIEIHGDGTGGGTNWTQGCVAIRNEQIDEIWHIVQVGTPVISEY